MEKPQNYLSRLRRHPLLWNLALIAAIILAMAVAAHILMQLGTRHGARRTVPDLSGVQLDQAQRIARKHDLQLHINDSLFVPAYEGGIVLDQLPEGGVEVKPGRTVYITINSFRQKMVPVPYVAGRSLRQAKNMLEIAGLEIAELVYRADMATNYVLEEYCEGKPVTPTTRMEAEMGSGVTLYVGVEGGHGTTVVPRLVGLPLMQVYGLTETSPMISMCAKGSNHPATVGFPLSDTQVRTGENDELQVKGPQVMQGYFNREADTRAAFTEDGWFKTGDQADLSDGGRIRIKGRIKEILVTSTGEKISPVDLEFAIQEDPLFEQVMAVGENRPYVSVLTVLNKARWQALCAEMQLDPMDPATMGRRDVRTAVLKRIKTVTRDFPRYGQPRNVAILPEAWTIDNGLLTPTLKLRRKPIAERFASEIDALYSGHQAAAR